MRKPFTITPTIKISVEITQGNIHSGLILLGFSNITVSRPYAEWGGCACVCVSRGGIQQAAVLQVADLLGISHMAVSAVL